MISLIASAMLRRASLAAAKYLSWAIVSVQIASRIGDGKQTEKAVAEAGQAAETAVTMDKENALKPGNAEFGDRRQNGRKEYQINESPQADGSEGAGLHEPNIPEQNHPDAPPFVP